MWTIDVEVEPGVGAGRLHFGMSVDEIRNILGKPTDTVGFEGKMHDVYKEIGLEVHWNELTRVCFALEFRPPASPLVFGSPLIACPYALATQFLKVKGVADLEMGIEGATSEKLGIHLNCELPTEKPGNPVTSIYIYSSKYF